VIGKAREPNQAGVRKSVVPLLYVAWYERVSPSVLAAFGDHGNAEGGVRRRRAFGPEARRRPSWKTLTVSNCRAVISLVMRCAAARRRKAQNMPLLFAEVLGPPGVRLSVRLDAESGPIDSDTSRTLTND
jgi:hypothetical protein